MKKRTLENGIKGNFEGPDAPVVYIVQKQMRFDRDAGELVPRFDLEPAEQFGRFEYLLSPSASPFKPQSVLDDLHRRLVKYSSKDHLLLIGNPCLIGFAVTVAAHYNNGRVNLLQWSGKDQAYLKISAETY